MEQKIEPHKVTKPIQLLAAWLVGLVLINGSFLTAAATINTPVWIVPTLVIASIVNVPLFLIAIFTLQTRFRPEMMEDNMYSNYLFAQNVKPNEKAIPLILPSSQDNRLLLFSILQYSPFYGAEIMYFLYLTFNNHREVNFERFKPVSDSKEYIKNDFMGVCYTYLSVISGLNFLNTSTINENGRTKLFVVNYDQTLLEVVEQLVTENNTKNLVEHLFYQQ